MEAKCLVLMLVIPALSLLAESQEGLRTGFYSSSCPRAESIVRSTVESHFNEDPTVAAGVLRLHFHDCFVQVLLLLSLDFYYLIMEEQGFSCVRVK